ncbi:putative late blight resistance protein homolog R1B-16 [Coffea arabica]|uniref:Late blight resistance protein homolog R1B-16 n=1 Tax=Coffea arabica TaxID=13443 RepID=A0A6P6UW74_COFAR|nr:putative late blight resistance protein homolog R1B-16 [Coffea arabica]
MANNWISPVGQGVAVIFPDDGNGSRILFTTRSHAVALEAKSLTYAFRLLSNEESYELLSMKLFNGDPCHKELSSISCRIASCCKGLPLALVLIAGTPKRTKRKKDSWKHVAKTLFRSLSIQEQILEILEVSYKRLPDHLKPCFCYLGTFPEGTTISVSKLMRLWNSEGFVQQSNWGRKNLKQEAESYLNELIDRSLVMIARKSSKGGVKACRVHNVLHEYCTAKLGKRRSVTREDISHGIAILLGSFRLHGLNFLHISTNISSLLYFHKPDGTELVSSGSLPPHARGFHSECAFRDFLSKGRHNLSEQIGLGYKKGLVHGTRTSQSRHLDYGSILKCKHLSVLDLGNVRVQSSADTSDLVKIAKLVHLKYLAVRIRTNNIPSDIGNLRNLETFLISGAIGNVMLPETIWKSAMERELILDHSFFSCEYYSQEFLENCSDLNNLKSISTISMQHASVEKFLRRLPNIEKLGCIFSSTWKDYFQACKIHFGY